MLNEGGSLQGEPTVLPENMPLVSDATHVKQDDIVSAQLM